MKISMRNFLTDNIKISATYKYEYYVVRLVACPLPDLAESTMPSKSIILALAEVITSIFLLINLFSIGPGTNSSIDTAKF